MKVHGVWFTVRDGVSRSSPQPPIPTLVVTAALKSRMRLSATKHGVRGGFRVWSSVQFLEFLERGRRVKL
jgi:hypothetical protein